MRCSSLGVNGTRRPGTGIGSPRMTEKKKSTSSWPSPQARRMRAARLRSDTAPPRGLPRPPRWSQASEAPGAVRGARTVVRGRLHDDLRTEVWHTPARAAMGRVHMVVRTWDRCRARHETRPPVTLHAAPGRHGGGARGARGRPGRLRTRPSTRPRQLAGCSSTSWPPSPSSNGTSSASVAGHPSHSFGTFCPDSDSGAAAVTMGFTNGARCVVSGGRSRVSPRQAAPAHTPGLRSVARSRAARSRSPARRPLRRQGGATRGTARGCPAARRAPGGP